MLGENAPVTKMTQRDDQHVMPWHIAAGDDGLLRDAILVATMDGEEMLTISLHVATMPTGMEVRRDVA